MGGVHCYMFYGGQNTKPTGEAALENCGGNM